MAELARAKAAAACGSRSPTCASCRSTAASTWSAASTTRSTTCTRRRNWSRRCAGWRRTSPRRPAHLRLQHADHLPRLLRRTRRDRGERPADDLGRPPDADVGPGEISEALFEVESLSPATGPPIEPELHRQRHHPEAEIRAAVARAGLELVALYGHHHDGVPHQPCQRGGATPRRIYVARTRARAERRRPRTGYRASELKTGSASALRSPPPRRPRARNGAPSRRPRGQRAGGRRRSRRRAGSRWSAPTRSSRRR